MILARSAALVRQSKLVSNVGVYAVGNMLMKAAGVVLIPIYTRYLTPEDYGITGYVLALEGVLVALLGLGIYGSITRYYYEYVDSPERQKQFITTNFLFLVIVSLGFALAASIYGERIWNHIASGNIPYTPYVEIVVWSSVLTVLSTIPYTLYRAEQRAGAFVTARFGQFLLGVTLAIILIVGIGLGALGQLLARLLAIGVVGLFLMALMLRQWFTTHLQWRDILISLRFGLPLVPHIVLGWALIAIDRFLLEPYVKLDELGYYNLAYNVGSVMLLLVSSFNMAWMPYYYELMSQSNNAEKTIRRTVELYTVIMGTICLFGILFGRQILQLLATERFLNSIQYVPLILFAYLLNGYYFFASAPLFYFKRTVLIPVMTFIAVVVNVVLNLLWIPQWGAMAAAWATVIAFAVVLVIALFLGRRDQPIDYPFFKLSLVNGLIFIAVLVSTYSLADGQFSMVLRIGWFGLFLIVAFFSLVRPNIVTTSK